MLLKTIAKFFAFVISLTVISDCHSNQKRLDPKAQNSADYAAPKVSGKIESNEITESSGLAVSKCQPNVFWTHNDSGDEAFIFAIDEKGETLGTYKVTDAKNVDWEDIAEIKNADGKCVLYIGDIGNNSLKRDEMTVYAVSEPQVSAAGKSSNKKNPLTTEAAQSIRFIYPDSPHNAETLMVRPDDGDIYILTKRLDAAAGVYKLKKDFDSTKPNKLEKITDLTVPAIPNGYLTGGAVAPDGRRLIICDYVSGYELTLPANAKNFDEIWKQTPKVVDLGDREQGESVSYSADGNFILAGSEGKNSPLFEVRRK